MELAGRVMLTRPVISGRRTYELAGHWNGDHHNGVPILVLTHDVPDEPRRVPSTSAPTPSSAGECWWEWVLAFSWGPVAAPTEASVDRLAGECLRGQPLLLTDLPDLVGGVKREQNDEAAEDQVRPARVGPERHRGHADDG